MALFFIVAILIITIADNVPLYRTYLEIIIFARSPAQMSDKCQKDYLSVMHE